MQIIWFNRWIYISLTLLVIDWYLIKVGIIYLVTPHWVSHALGPWKWSLQFFIVSLCNINFPMTTKFVTNVFRCIILINCIDLLLIMMKIVIWLFSVRLIWDVDGYLIGLILDLPSILLIPQPVAHHVTFSPLLMASVSVVAGEQLFISVFAVETGEIVKLRCRLIRHMVCRQGHARALHIVLLIALKPSTFPVLHWQIIRGMHIIWLSPKLCGIKNR